MVSDFTCYRIKGKVMGIIGYGRIGREFHQRVSGLGLSKILVFDPYIEQTLIRESNGISVDFDTLIREADYISLHVPLTPETRGMISSREFNSMKQGVIIINTSRGGVIDEADLIDALRDGRVDSAGLDVFTEEPLPPSHAMKRMENVILSDHTAFYTEESLVELKTKAALNIIEVFKGRKPLYPLNQIGG